MFRRLNWYFKSAIISGLLMAATHGFSFDLSHLAMKTATDAVFSQGKKWVEKATEKSSVTVPAAGTIEVAFSPNESAESLVVKVIDSARSEIRMMSYSFTSPVVAKALLDARHRGVSVQLVADWEGNASKKKDGTWKSPKSIAAMSSLVTAGAEVRTIAAYDIAHDKVIVVDGATVETGSFNYSASAANRNSENVLVNWNNPALAKVYLQHFERNFRQGVAFKAAY